MAELKNTKLNAESHLLLDQSLLRLPHELIRQNFKNARRAIEREKNDLLETCASAANAALKGQDTSMTLASIDHMMERMQGLKRKLEALHEDDKNLHRHSRKRIQHLQDLYAIPSLVDVKYDEWSRIRLNRLLVDCLLRTGYNKSARALAKDKGIEELVDIKVFEQCHKIQDSLRNRSTHECLKWCSDNRPALKKLDSNLEFQLRLQQYVELARTGQREKLLEATHHAKQYLAPHKNTQFQEMHVASGLLAFPSDTRAEPFRSMYSLDRWETLAYLFMTTHHSLYSLPARPLLHIALSAGLSALKTPSCHSSQTSSSSNANSSTTSVCPICSTELNELALNVPYAHHTKSSVESDPVVLPNGRIYGRDRLLQMSVKVGMPDGLIKDPTTGQMFLASEARKVYIS
ncbi:MAG: GID complex subunit containing RING finger motif [Sarcosagium campestre]|nr:MAG: GID complex subunit containing RING finger motif [Sarcosagium campestre]